MIKERLQEVVRKYCRERGITETGCYFEWYENAGFQVDPNKPNKPNMHFRRAWEKEDWKRS